MPYNAISTSRMFGKEKSTAFQKILIEIRHMEPAMMFMNHDVSQDEIVKDKNVDFKVSAHDAFLGITFIRYAQNRTIRKPNNSKFWE